jgi:hypothetical protein
MKKYFKKGYHYQYTTIIFANFAPTTFGHPIILLFRMTFVGSMNQNLEDERWE